MNRIFLAILIVIFGLGVTAFIRLSSNSIELSESDGQNLNSESSFITVEILGEHNSAEDCWVAYDGKVYDVTSFLPRHPGSAGAIIPHCGTYESFTNAFEGQHGKSKVSNLMKVGTLMGDFQIQGEI